MSLEQARRLGAMMLSRRGVPLALVDRRAAFEAQMNAAPLPEDARFTPAEGGLWVDVPESAPDAAILWLHGGAFVLGSSASYRGFGVRLARAAQARVFLLDYPLSPESPFPAALEATSMALARLQGEGFAQIAIGGDSAGANLAVAAVQASQAKPNACLLLSPYLDLTHSGESVITRGSRDPFVDTSTMTDTAATYLGDADPADIRVSPLFGDIDGFPPTLIQVGSEETLFSDAERFAKRLDAAHFAVTFQEWAGMPHVWPIFAGQIDEGAWAIAQMGNFLRNLG